MAQTALILAPLFLAAQVSMAGDINPPPLDTPYDQWLRLATHNAYANPDEGFDYLNSNQPYSIAEQLNYGVRVINPDLWLVRQKQVVNPITGICQWKFEEYPGASTDVRDSDFAGLPLEVVVAHGDNDRLYGGFRQYCTPWKPLTAVLNQIGAWLDNHPNEVATVVFETKINSAYETNYINPAINASRMAKYIFHPSRPNPDVPAPEGRPGGWLVDKYGYPTLRQLVQAGKRAVMYPPYLPRAAPNNTWKLEVMTVYGHQCLPPFDIGQNWVLPRGESAALNDFTRPLFAVVHVPDLPQINDYAPPGGVNDIRTLRAKWADILALYNRLPTAIWMDYYDRGYNGLFNPGDPPAPALFVNELNAIWSSRPNITAVAQTTPQPSAYGWNNTDVQVSLSGTGDAIQAIISRTWSGSALPNPAAANRANYRLQDEGVTTVSFHAVGNLGKRSLTKLVDVAIDKTVPTIGGMLARSPNYAGWYASDVTAHFQCADVLSGIASCTPDVVLSTEGANQSVTGMAIDRADNQSTTTITNINIDKTAPTIAGMLDRPPNQAGWYASDVTAHFQCADALSGIASCTPDVVLSTEGANQSVPGMAVDRADNQSTTTITNINIDKTAPVVRSLANPSFLWPPNGKLVPVRIVGTMTDAVSGVDPVTASFAVSDDYQRIQPTGRVVVSPAGTFSFTVHLEAQRAGGDRDGRNYVVRLNVADRAGHAGLSTITINVPHDSRPR